MTSQKTFSARPGEVDKRWRVVDADGLVVGRLASLVATWLRGKHKPQYTPHTDCGDYVIVINARKVVFTGNKLKDKKYHRHTGYPGGLRTTTPERILQGRFPHRVLRKAITRMMPDGPLARRQLKKLRVYDDAIHKHQAQRPEPVDVAAMNAKNAPPKKADRI